MRRPLPSNRVVVNWRLPLTANQASIMMIWVLVSRLDVVKRWALPADHILAVQRNTLTAGHVVMREGLALAADKSALLARVVQWNEMAAGHVVMRQGLSLAADEASIMMIRFLISRRDVIMWRPFSSHRVMVNRRLSLAADQAVDWRWQEHGHG